MCRTLDVSGFKHKDEGCPCEVMVRFADGDLAHVDGWDSRSYNNGDVPPPLPSLEGARLVCPRCRAEAPIPKQA